MKCVNIISEHFYALLYLMQRPPPKDFLLINRYLSISLWTRVSFFKNEIPPPPLKKKDVGK